MKKLVLVFILVFVMSAAFQGCRTKNETGDSPHYTEETLETEAPKNNISKEMAYDGVYNYCRSAYDWSIAENNPDLMYLKFGEET